MSRFCIKFSFILNIFYKRYTTSNYITYIQKLNISIYFYYNAYTARCCTNKKEFLLDNLIV